MNKIIYSFIIIPFFLSCTSEKKTAVGGSAEVVEENNKVINIDDAFKDIREIRLSEIADSISFLPLETTQAGLVSNIEYNFNFTPFYIIYYSGIFDWTGKFRGNIVKRGQGPYEEPESGKLIFHNNHFYSKGSKLIEYDHTGTPTGKTRRLYESRTFSDKDELREGIEFFNAGKNLAVYDYPNRIYFINTDFEIISSRLVVESDSTNKRGYITGNNFISYYKDKTLFYNYMNDTIFYVTDDGLEPQWIVNFTLEQRLSTEVLLIPDKIFRDEEIKILSSGSRNFENARGVLLFDNKHITRGVFETDKYIIFRIQELTHLAKARGKKEKAPYIVIFDKSILKTFRVKGDGFVDDLTGFAGMNGKNFFFPSKGIIDEKMVHIIWPFEILDFIEESQKAGRLVNPRLLEFSKTLKPDDNPVLVLVHLKRK